MKARRMIAAAALVGVMAATGCSGNVGTNADRLANNTARVTGTRNEVTNTGVARAGATRGGVARNGATRNGATRNANSDRLANSAGTTRRYNGMGFFNRGRTDGRVSSGRITLGSDRLSYNTTNYRNLDGHGYGNNFRGTAGRLTNNIGRRGVVGRHSTTLTNDNNANFINSRNAHFNDGMGRNDTGTRSYNYGRNTGRSYSNGLQRVAPMSDNTVV